MLSLESGNQEEHTHSYSIKTVSKHVGGTTPQQPCCTGFQMPGGSARRLSPSGYPWVVITNACSYFFPLASQIILSSACPTSVSHAGVGVYWRSLISQKLPLNSQARITHHQGHGQSPEGPRRPTNARPVINGLPLPPNCHP